MKENIYRVFITGEEERFRFFDIVSTFEDIDRRITSNHISRHYNRVIIQLTDEELAVIKISFSPDECIILKATEADLNSATLYDTIIRLQEEREISNKIK